jgi:quinol monooxygenase YgiN
MYARSTTFQAEPSRLDDGIAFVRDEVMPSVTATEGCAGLSLLVDPDSGRCIVTSSWHDEASLRASEERVRPLRDRGAQLFGTTPTVDVWEIALLHRVQDAPEGACVRVTWTRGDPARAEEMIDMFRTRAISVMEGLTGFCSASLFVDRAGGRAVTSATYDSRASLELSQTGASQLRSGILQEAGLELEDIAEFELLLAHLRVPETV